ncbi:MAG TPA: phosphoethanolamine--lipid A transferase [Solimonas sp.]
MPTLQRSPAPAHHLAVPVGVPAGAPAARASAIGRRPPRIGAITLTALVALYLAITQNAAFLKAVQASLPQPWGWEEWRLLATVFAVLLSLLFLALLPFAQRSTLKPGLIVMLLVSSVCSYFMDSYGVVIDRAMLVNVMSTDTREAGDLLRSAFVVHVLLQGVIPAWLVGRCAVPDRPALSSALRRAALALAVLVTLSVVFFVQYDDAVFWGRQHRDVRLYINPTYPLYSASQYLREAMPRGPQAPLLPVAPDAIRQSRQVGERPLLVVLVLGETARAANFQLNGYERPTNPRLSQLPELINFPRFSACGTATAESVPCLFSALGRSDFSRAKARAQENLLDVLQRVGVDVKWRDNDSGCQGVCARMGMESLERATDPALCTDGECLDGILLRDLDRLYPPAGAARLLVLHQKGSHGPAYFKRYPERARRFQPDCRDENVQRCSHQQVLNSYDNSLVYTDDVLADLIGSLRAQQQQMDSVVLYVSDHGESLGENGIYLHGLPYRLAPVEQTHVPMMAWFSSNAAGSLNLDLSCLRKASQTAYSHDNLFPSLLGLLDVKTRAYDAASDIFATCRH